PRDRRRPQDLEGQEAEVVEQEQLADELLGVVHDADDAGDDPERGTRDDEDHQQAGVEDDREPEHRPRLDPAYDAADPPPAERHHGLLTTPSGRVETTDAHTPRSGPGRPRDTDDRARPRVRSPPASARSPTGR